MPYIEEQYRKRAEHHSASIGELNYAITKHIDDYLKLRHFCYENINAVIGVLECAKLELYRRIASPYEDKKKEENGDVFSCLNGNP